MVIGDAGVGGGAGEGVGGVRIRWRGECRSINYDIARGHGQRICVMRIGIRIKLQPKYCKVARSNS